MIQLDEADFDFKKIIIVKLRDISVLIFLFLLLLLPFRFYLLVYYKLIRRKSSESSRVEK